MGPCVVIFSLYIQGLVWPVDSQATCVTNTYKRDSVDCSVFYQCDNNAWVRQVCPTGLVFDESISTCDYPQGPCDLTTQLTTLTTATTTPTSQHITTQASTASRTAPSTTPPVITTTSSGTTIITTVTTPATTASTTATPVSTPISTAQTTTPPASTASTTPATTPESTTPTIAQTTATPVTTTISSGPTTTTPATTPPTTPATTPASTASTTATPVSTPISTAETTPPATTDATTPATTPATTLATTASTTPTPVNTTISTGPTATTTLASPPQTTASATLVTSDPEATTTAAAATSSSTTAESAPINSTTASTRPTPTNLPLVRFDAPYRYLVPRILMDSSTCQSAVDVSITTMSSGIVYVRLNVVESDVIVVERNFTLTTESPTVLNISDYARSQTNETGVYDTLVFLLSSDPVHVLLFHKNEVTSAASMASISPMSSASPRYVVSTCPPMNQNLTGYVSYIAVVAVENSTHVSLGFPVGRQPAVTLRINKVKVTGPRLGATVLDSMQTLLVVSQADLTGTLINCSKPVLVYTGSVLEQSSVNEIWTLEQQESVTVASLTYIILPSLNASDDVYRIVAVHGDTTLQVPHVIGQNSTSGVVNFRYPGDAVDLKLSSADQFHVILSDKPVQVTRFARPLLISSGTPDVCSASILSQQAWANNYSWSLPAYLAKRADLSVYLFVVMKISLAPALLFDGQTVNADWRNLTSGGYKSELCGTVLKVDTQYHNVSLNQSAGNFSVYLLISGPGLRMCTSLGHVSSQVTDTDFGDWTACGDQEIKTGFDPPTTTTEAQTTATTTESAAPDWTTDASDVTTHAPTTTTTTSAASPSVNCSTCWATPNATTLLNLTSEELDSIIEAIKAHLYVNPKVTSAYKRTLECAPDYRPVSNSIGIAGILFCTLVTLCIVASDLPLLLSRFTKCGTS